MSKVSKFELPIDTLRVIKSFAKYSPFMEVMPSGRSFISYRKGFEEYGKFGIELWIDFRPPTLTTLSIPELLQGRIQTITVDSLRDPSWLVLTGKRFVGKPVASFSISSADFKILKPADGVRHRRSIRLDRNSAGGRTIDEEGSLVELTLSTFDGISCQFAFHRELRRRLPVGNYWVKLFPNCVASFENIDRSFTFLTVMGDITPIADVTSNLD